MRQAIARALSLLRVAEPLARAAADKAIQLNSWLPVAQLIAGGELPHLSSKGVSYSKLENSRDLMASREISGPKESKTHPKKGFLFLDKLVKALPSCY